MGAEMIRLCSPFGTRSTSIMGGTIACVIMLIALPASAQTSARSGTAGSAAGTASMPAVSQNGTAGNPGGFADLAEKVVPAVIAVVAKVAPTSQSSSGRSSELGEPDDDAPAQESPGPRLPRQGKAPDAGQAITMGSGFFISPDGYAVTNNHVVEDSDTAEIRTSDEKTYSAKVIGKDPLSDIALIKVDGRNDFSYVKLADQPPRVGDWVLTAGNPFGLGGTVTAGIVSARERNIGIGSAIDGGFIQIDASVNNGDSGGPSFNTRGEVVGVNSMIFSPSGGSVGVAFAIPAYTVKTVIPQLKDKGTVTRGWVGAEIQTVTPELADGLGAKDLHGAIVAKVQGNGPAARAGLTSGDVITAVNGEPIKSANELTKKVHGMKPGSSVQFAMVRQGKENSLKVTLGEMPRPDNTVGVAGQHSR
jgi:serine protease Do